MPESVIAESFRQILLKIGNASCTRKQTFVGIVNAESSINGTSLTQRGTKKEEAFKKRKKTLYETSQKVVLYIHELTD